MRLGRQTLLALPLELRSPQNHRPRRHLQHAGHLADSMSLSDKPHPIPPSAFQLLCASMRSHASEYRSCVARSIINTGINRSAYMRFCVVELAGQSGPRLAVAKGGGLLPLDAPPGLRTALEQHGA